MHELILINQHTLVHHCVRRGIFRDRVSKIYATPRRAVDLIKDTLRPIPRQVFDKDNIRRNINSIMNVYAQE